MLTLPTKKKWFDMEPSEEKTEEYREIKEYWDCREEKLLIQKGENHGEIDGTEKK